MALRWTAEQVAIYELIQSGAKNRDLKAQGHKLPMVKKVRLAMGKGDTPQKPPSELKGPPSGEPLYSATLKTKKVTLEPIVAVRYDSVRHALGLGDDYTLEQFLDESTDIITELVGAVPPGFVKGEEKEVAAV
ncbi:hypothetical protein ES706_04870 [subsurface metagenome]